MAKADKLKSRADNKTKNGKRLTSTERKARAKIITKQTRSRKRNLIKYKYQKEYFAIHEVIVKFVDDCITDEVKITTRSKKSPFDSHYEVARAFKVNGQWIELTLVHFNDDVAELFFDCSTNRAPSQFIESYMNPNFFTKLEEFVKKLLQYVL